MSMSNYLETKIIDATLRNTSYSSPATVYLALFTTDPTDAGTGTEVSGGGYERKAITFTDANPTLSAADVVFPTATADWGEITHWGIFDAETEGNLLYHGAFATPRTIVTDTTIIAKAGQISIGVD
jgi:hypothetical protein